LPHDIVGGGIYVKSLFFVLFDLDPAEHLGRGQCGQRDISGTWNVLISGTKAAESLSLTQSGTSVSGRADLQTALNPYKDGGKVTGRIQGETIILEVSWVNDRQTLGEEFKGSFAQDGTISGKASVWALAGSVDVGWVSDRPMRCLSQKVTKLGVKNTVPAASGAPFITATPNNIALPFGQTAAPTTLVWDGGKDHPYAEVWVKVNGQRETKILEKGAGTLPYPITVGINYVFILTDAGTTLATVTVQFRQ
jgi:hypothetical protein